MYVIQIYASKHMALFKQTFRFFNTGLFIVSNSFLNQISKCRIQPGIMSDHSLISLELNLNKIERRKGYIKVNDSLILQP